MNNKSVVLKKVEQLLNRSYNGQTPKDYLFHISKFLDFCKNVPDRVNNEDFLNYNLFLCNKKCSYSYRNVAINAIKAYFKLYLRKEVKAFAAIRPPKENKLPKDIPHDFLISKIKSIKSSKHKLIMVLGYGCGLRSNEVINLKVNDIDIPQLKILVKGKGNKERIIPISPNTANLILKYISEWNPTEYLLYGRANNGDFKNKYTSSSILKLVKRFIGSKYTFHQLRHSYATKLLRNGLQINELAKLLGHSKIETSMIYNHLLTTEVKRDLLPV